MRMSSWLGRVDIAHDEKTSLANKGLLSTISVTVQGLIRTVYSILIGNLLTPALLAAVNSAISLALFMSLLWPNATSAAATKFIARSRGSGDSGQAAAIAAHLARVTAVTAGLLAVPAGAFSYLFQARNDLATAVLVMLLVIAYSGYTFVRGIYFAIGQINRSVAWDVITAVVAIGLLVGVIWAGWTALLLAPLTVGYLIYAIAGWPRRHRGDRLPHPLRQEMNGFTAWTLVGTLASTGFLQLTMIIAQGVGHGTEAGMYAAALTLATPTSMLARSLSLVLFPAMAHATGRGDLAAVRRQTDLATRGLVVVMGGAFAALILNSQLIIDLFWGARYADAVGILPILLIASLLVTLNVGAVNSLSTTTSSGVRIPALLSVVGMAVGLTTMALLIPRLGVTGVAWGYLAGTVVTGFGPIVFIWVQDRMPWGGLWLRAALGAIALVLISIGRDGLGWGLAGDVLATVAFALVWAALMWPYLGMLNSVRKPTAG